MHRYLDSCFFVFLGGDAWVGSVSFLYPTVLQNRSCSGIFIRWSALGLVSRHLFRLADEKKKERKKKKKKVRFAADVKEPRGNGDEFRMKTKRTRKSSPVERSCRSEIPANRVALYSGILRDRANRMECSH